MTLGYSQTFPWGEPTLFREKILKEFDNLARPLSIELSGDELKSLMAQIDSIDNPKLHTIRQDPTNRWREGRDIHHVYGNRTKARKCFLKNRCLSTQRIVILYEETVVSTDQGEGKDGIERPVVMVDFRVMSPEQVDLIAKNDGFKSTDDFFRWFDKPFSGVIIHWTKLRY